MENLVEQVTQWIKDRNIDSQDPKIQMCKTIEELGELARGLNKNDLPLVKDSIGDVMVTLIAICTQTGLDISECLSLAYNEIKDRKGKLIDGIFVKESDLLKTEL